MATIELADSHRDFVGQIREEDDNRLVAQDLVQQGAIHAISFLLQHGCTEETATSMLASLRDNARLIRKEAERRGKSSLFATDQTRFT